MSVIRKRGSAYSNYKNEGRVARLCIAIVFLLIAAAVFLMDTSLTRSIKEGLLGAFSYDMHRRRNYFRAKRTSRLTGEQAFLLL